MAKTKALQQVDNIQLFIQLFSRLLEEQIFLSPPQTWLWDTARREQFLQVLFASKLPLIVKFRRTTVVRDCSFEQMSRQEVFSVVVRHVTDKEGPKRNWYAVEASNVAKKSEEVVHTSLDLQDVVVQSQLNLQSSVEGICAIKFVALI